jgi:hypothetical protein
MSKASTPTAPPSSVAHVSLAVSLATVVVDAAILSPSTAIASSLAR